VPQLIGCVFFLSVLVVSEPLIAQTEETHSSLLDESIEVLTGLNEVLAAVKDEASAEARQSEIVEFAKRMRTLTEKAEKLGPVPEDQKEELAKPAGKVQTQSKQLINHLIRISGDRYASEIVEAALRSANPVPSTE